MLQYPVFRAEEHHRNVPYQDELRQLLREAGVEWDEPYLWDLTVTQPLQGCWYRAVDVPGFRPLCGRNPSLRDGIPSG